MSVKITNKKNGHSETVSDSEWKSLQDNGHSGKFDFQEIKTPAEIAGKPTGKSSKEKSKEAEPGEE